MRKSSIALALGVVFLSGLTARGDDVAPRQKSSPGASLTSLADGQVRKALAAELAGDDANREALLAQAIHDDPDCRTARWQAGFALLDGKWLAPEEAARKYAKDGNLAEYHRRRDQAAQAGLFSRTAISTEFSGTSIPRPAANNNLDTIDRLHVQAASAETFSPDVLPPAGIAAHAQLARWCRSKRMADEERAHLTQVLLNDPSNGEAQARLGVRWFMGDFRTSAQIEEFKKQFALEEKQRNQWLPTVLRWKNSLDNATAAEPSQAAAEMRDVKDPAVIPALASTVWSDSAKPSAKRDAASAFQREGVAWLGRLSVQRATYSLTQLSVLGKQAELRGAAANELRSRNLHDFVPILLNGLANPVQFDYLITLDADGMASYSAVLAQEGRDVERQIKFADSFWSNVVFNFYASDLKITMLEARHYENGLFANDVATRNRPIKQLDDRISLVMERVTGQQPACSATPAGDSDVIPDSAVASSATTTADYWWNWWDKYNEVYTPYKPYEITQCQYSTVLPWSNMVLGCSCFPAGTLIPTIVGPTAIEKIQIGDRVLAQDAQTGELAYKPVLGTTIRPPADLIAMTTSTGLVRSTRGHAFWIDGKGWQMAKQLNVGARLHGLHGASTISAIASGSPEAAYNLNVADFHTYFVGDAGQLLVHDCSPRLPTSATIPGLVTKNQ